MADSKSVIDSFINGGTPSVQTPADKAVPLPPSQQKMDITTPKKEEDQATVDVDKGMLPENKPMPSLYNPEPQLVKDKAKIKQTKQLSEPKNPKPGDNTPKEEKRDPAEVVENLGDITEVTAGLTRFTQALKTPGGLGAVFALCIFLLWTIMPTSSGYTRLQLLWFTLLGRTSLSSSPIIQDSSISQQIRQDVTNLTNPPTGQSQGQGPTQAQVNQSNAAYAPIVPNVNFSFGLE